MPALFLRPFGQETTVDFALADLDGVDLNVGATFAAGDLVISGDEGAEGNTANLPVDEGTGYSLTLTATEVQVARAIIYIIDQTGPKAWLDDYLVIETYGHPSSQHPDFGNRAARFRR